MVAVAHVCSIDGTWQAVWGVACRCIGGHRSGNRKAATAVCGAHRGMLCVLDCCQQAGRVHSAWLAPVRSLQSAAKRGSCSTNNPRVPPAAKRCPVSIGRCMPVLSVHHLYSIVVNLSLPRPHTCIGPKGCASHSCRAVKFVSSSGNSCGSRCVGQHRWRAKCHAAPGRSGLLQPTLCAIFRAIVAAAMCSTGSACAATTAAAAASSSGQHDRGPAVAHSCRC